jgi:glucose-6-phosphate dehydrogenase assembly protein OpcA
VQAQQVDGSTKVCFDAILIEARGEDTLRLPYVVRSLVIGDLPINTWWAVPEPPSAAGPLLEALIEDSQQIIFDSQGWREPVPGIASTAAWLETVESHSKRDRWRAVSDLNWRRLKYWRRLVSQALDPASAPGALESVTRVEIAHGPHAGIQGWLLLCWLASRLGWRVASGNVEPGSQMRWTMSGAAGDLDVKLCRLAEGEPAIEWMRVSCTIAGRQTVLHFQAASPCRLSVAPEGRDAAPRTITVPPFPSAILLANQLSDRERDPVYHESLALARQAAQAARS